MKVCIIQPLYSADWNDSEKLFKWELDIMDKCDESMDLIVLPESTDVPAYAKTFEQHRESYRRYNKAILDKAKSKKEISEYFDFPCTHFEATREALRHYIES